MKVFISCPVTVPTEDFDAICFKVKTFRPSVSFVCLDRRECNVEFVKKCDIFILHHQDNKMSFNILSLPKGMKLEFKEALALGKKIGIAHKNKKGVFQFYNFVKTNNFINCIIPKGFPPKYVMKLESGKVYKVHNSDSFPHRISVKDDQGNTITVWNWDKSFIACSEFS